MKSLILIAALLLPSALWCQGTAPIPVTFHTNEGDIDVNLLPAAAPKTVANFLKYVHRGAYSYSIIHRSVANFIFQGGAYTRVNHVTYTIPVDAPVVNEFNLSNTRGTLAMAKVDGDPNSATSQFFFNESDSNAASLDVQNGGFTVFGRVANAASLAVMDKIANMPIYNAGPPFDAVPIDVANFTQNDQAFILVNSISVAGEAPVISPGGIISASAFGAFRAAAPGSYIEIYGTGLAGITGQWAASDFINGAAPTQLAGVSVTVNGVPAYVYAVSPTQVNVQVPVNVPTTGQVPVVLTYNGIASAPVMLSMQATSAGLLAPPSFLVGKQFVYAAHSSNGKVVSNGSIPGIPAAPAAPGETVVLYGLGFGAVNETSVPIAGRIATGQTTLVGPLQIRVGNSPATIGYAGLAPGYVGLYQFNITIPADAPTGELPVTVTLAGTADTQTLYIPVQAP